MTAPNWVRRPEAAARTLVRRTATLGAAVARTVGAQEIAAIASFECKTTQRGTWSRLKYCSSASWRGSQKLVAAPWSV